MNMKKAIAGVFAGAVAISAVATTMASAKTVSYAAIDKTFELSGVKGYKALNFTDDSKTSVSKLYPETKETKSKTVKGLTIEASNNVDYTIQLVSGTDLPTDPIAKYISSNNTTVIQVQVKDADDVTETNLQAALNGLVPNVFTVSGNSELAEGDTNIIWDLTTTTIITPTPIDKSVDVADTLTFKFSEAIENFKISFNGGNNNITLSEKDASETDNDGIKISEDGKIVTISGLSFAGNANYAVSMDYDVKAPSSSVYKYKSEAQKANPDKTVTIKAYATDKAGTLTKTTLFEAIAATKFDSYPASFEVKPAEGDKYLKVSESNSGSYNTAKSISDWTSNVKDGVLKNGEDIVDAVAEAIEGRLKAQVIFNFDDPKWGSDDAVYVTAWFDTRDFGILKKTVKMDTSNWTAAFDWADFVKSATSGTSTLGDVSNKIRDIRIAVDTRDENGKEIALKSITVKGPAESAEVLSAGESVADTTAAITTAATAATTTAATTTAATTTAAASNPKTGNAPVALAVIPVAIAAAAIIAKKRG